VWFVLPSVWFVLLAELVGTPRLPVLWSLWVAQALRPWWVVIPWLGESWWLALLGVRV
jgi:hypothetical protein